MRNFKIYSPTRIAKHVCSVFKGQFTIHEQGMFSFDGGKVIIDENADEQQKRIGREINMVIAKFLKGSRQMDAHYE